MIAQYVLKSFSRHKARTVIMVLALVIVTAMLVTLNNGVESLQQQIIIFFHAVLFVFQAIQRCHTCVSVQCRLAEYIGQDRDKKIYLE